MTALWPQWATDLLDHPTVVQQISDTHGPVFHVVHPPTFAANLADFRHVLDSLHVSGEIYYAKKANKSPSWLRALADADAGVDVASVGEFRSALGHGICGSHIVVTGPAKSPELLWLAVRHGALVAIDEISELDRIIALGAKEKPARILLRTVASTESKSRFGMTLHERCTALTRCAEAGERVQMEGFSFHLSGYDPLARASEVDRLVPELLDARRRGFPAYRLSVGGGFSVNYVSAPVWEEFHNTNHSSNYHADKEFSEDFYPYHQVTSGAEALRVVLLSEGTHGISLAQKLRHEDIQLIVEPGRSLLADAGITVYAIQGFKWRDSLDYGIATVAGTSMSLSEQWFSSEFLPEPRLWPARALDQLTPTAVGGASCLDSDMVSWRKIPLPRPPQRGDFLIYPNTAGYQMDSNESAFHELPIPQKVLLEWDEEGPRWSSDHTFVEPRILPSSSRSENSLNSDLLPR